MRWNLIFAGLGLAGLADICLRNEFVQCLPGFLLLTFVSLSNVASLSVKHWEGYSAFPEYSPFLQTLSLSLPTFALILAPASVIVVMVVVTIATAIVVGFTVLLLYGRIRAELGWNSYVEAKGLERYVAHQQALVWVFGSLFIVLVTIVGPLPIVYFSGFLAVGAIALFLFVANECDDPGSFIEPGKLLMSCAVVVAVVSLLVSATSWGLHWQVVMFVEYIVAGCIMIWCIYTAWLIRNGESQKASFRRIK